MRAAHSVPAAQAEHKVQRGLRLDVVVAQRATVLQLLAGEDQALLVRRDTLLVLDLGLDVLDRVAVLDVESHRSAGQCSHEDLHGIGVCVVIYLLVIAG